MADIKNRVEELGAIFIKCEDSILYLIDKSGHEFSINRDSIYRMTQNKKNLCCRDCSNRELSKSRRTDPEEVRNFIVSKGAVPLFKDEDYINCKTSKLQFKCSCGEVYSKTYRSMLTNCIHGLVCLKCAKNYTKSNKDVIEKWFSNYGALPDLSQYKNIYSKIPFICRCGNEHYTSYKKKFETRKKQDLCCIKCSLLKNSGSNHYAYDSSLTEEDRNYSRDSPWYGDWVKTVLRRDNFKCVISNSTRSLQVHHLYSWTAHPHLRVFISNGVSLTKELHLEFHKKYGNKINFKWQFEEFYEYKTGNKFNRKENQINDNRY